MDRGPVFAEDEGGGGAGDAHLVGVDGVLVGAGVGVRWFWPVWEWGRGLCLSFFDDWGLTLLPGLRRWC